jgi:hypothetical protein
MDIMRDEPGASATFNDGAADPPAKLRNAGKTAKIAKKSICIRFLSIENPYILIGIFLPNLKLTGSGNSYSDYVSTAK